MHVVVNIPYLNTSLAYVHLWNLMDTTKIRNASSHKRAPDQLSVFGSYAAYEARTNSVNLVLDFKGPTLTKLCVFFPSYI